MSATFFATETVAARHTVCAAPRKALDAPPSRENRRPRGLDRNERSLAVAIQHRERAYQATAYRMLLVGIPALFIAPVLLASLVVAIGSKWHAAQTLSWWPCVTLASLALVPLLFWVERRSRGQWMRSEMSGESVTIGEALLSPNRQVGVRSATLGAIGEILLPAPRMILAARERLNTIVSAATLHDAVATINFLRFYDGGVPVADLPSVQPLRVLCYLVSREWVAVSKSGDRVWLLESAKAMLRAELATFR